jgi:hypothetical protein
LFVNIWVAVIGSFLTIDAWWGVLWKGAFYEIPGLACRSTILPWACTWARVISILIAQNKLLYV